jgi:hypothetical protein
MQTEIVVALISSILGGLLVAVANHLFTRRKTEAEIEKLKAETQKTTAETEKIRREWLQLNSVGNDVEHLGLARANKTIWFDSSMGFQGYDLTAEYSKYSLEQGVLVISDPNASLIIQSYIHNGKEIGYIPHDITHSGQRKFHISCEMKAINSSHMVNIFLWEVREEAESIDDRQVTVMQDAWAKTEFHYRVPSDIDFKVHILTERHSMAGSLQVRNLLVAEILDR